MGGVIAAPPRGNGELVTEMSSDLASAEAEDPSDQEFGPSGAFRAVWGTPGIGKGQFGDPFAIIGDSHGNVVVTENDNDRVQRFGDTTRPTATLIRPGAGRVSRAPGKCRWRQ